MSQRDTVTVFEEVDKKPSAPARTMIRYDHQVHAVM